jgi:hypothetical protein
MRRVMIQVDQALLERARLGARQRGITFPQLVRTALEHELSPRPDKPPAMTGRGVFHAGGTLLDREYEPDPWR